MFLFKSKKPIEPKKEAEQVNVDLELVTKMNQDFALSLDLNDTLMNALRVIIARLNAEAANIFLINEQKKKFECNNYFFASSIVICKNKFLFIILQHPSTLSLKIYRY